MTRPGRGLKEVDAIALMGVAHEPGDVEAVVGTDGGLPGGKEPPEAGEDTPMIRTGGTHVGEPPHEPLEGPVVRSGARHPTVALDFGHGDAYCHISRADIDWAR